MVAWAVLLSGAMTAWGQATAPIQGEAVSALVQAAAEPATVAGTLIITAGPGQRGVFTPATLKDYPHQTVTIFDHHTNANETYWGIWASRMAKISTARPSQSMWSRLAPMGTKR